MQIEKDNEIVSCDLCGNNTYQKITKQTDLIHKTTDEYFDVVKCKNCGLVFTNPRPKKETIGKYYSNKYSFHKDSSYVKKIINAILSRLVNIFLIKSLSPLFPRKINRKLI